MDTQYYIARSFGGYRLLVPPENMVKMESIPYLNWCAGGGEGRGENLPGCSLDHVLADIQAQAKKFYQFF